MAKTSINIADLGYKPHFAQAAKALGIEQHAPGKKGRDMLDALRKAHADVRKNPTDHELVAFIERYLCACNLHPEAELI